MKMKKHYFSLFYTFYYMISEYLSTLSRFLQARNNFKIQMIEIWRNSQHQSQLNAVMLGT